MPDFMKAAVLEEYQKPLVIREVPYPKPGPGEVTIKILASGLCASDLHLQDGRIPSSHVPYTPGHEMVGQASGTAGAGVHRYHLRDLPPVHLRAGQFVSVPEAPGL